MDTIAVTSIAYNMHDINYSLQSKLGHYTLKEVVGYR